MNEFYSSIRFTNRLRPPHNSAPPSNRPFIESIDPHPFYPPIQQFVQKMSDSPTKKTKKMMAKSKKGSVASRVKAMHHVAFCFINGNGGLIQSFQNGALWFEKAALLGHQQSMYLTADIWSNPSLNNKEKSRFWFQACVDKGKPKNHLDKSYENSLRNLQFLDDFEQNQGEYAPVETETKTCEHCQEEETESLKLKACKCHSVFYCNAECQKNNWRDHKELCKETRRKDKKADKDLMGKAVMITAEESNKTFACETCAIDIPQFTDLNVGVAYSIQQLHVLCCGGHLCYKCYQRYFTTQIHASAKCVLCKQKMPAGDNQLLKFALKLAKKKQEGWLFSFIGEQYYRGTGCARSPEKAFKHLKAGAEIGDTSCQFQVASAYENGLGIKKSLKRALKWYLLAAENGNASAQYNAGNLYRTKNIDKTIQYWTLAADQNHGYALWKLGGLYDGGVVGEWPSSLDKAIDFYTRSAAVGNENGQWDLGLCCLSGVGGPIDNVKAMALIEAAAKQINKQTHGAKTAVLCLTTITKDMEQIEPTMNPHKDKAKFLDKWNVGNAMNNWKGDQSFGFVHRRAADGRGERG